MVRSVAAVLGGWAVVGILVVATDFLLMALFPHDYVAGRRPPDALAAAGLVTSTLYSVLGGWLTVRIAARKPWLHALALAAWGELMGTISTVANWGRIQEWYQIGLLVMWVPAVLAGAWIRAGRPGRQQAARN